MTHLARRLRVWCALVLLAPLLSACLEPDRTTIAVMMSSTADETWQRVVWPTFKRRVESTCDGCHITTYDAEDDAQTQARQLKAALADKVDAIVLDAVSSETGEQLVVDAGEVPVISYRGFIAGADYGVTVDDEDFVATVASGISSSPKAPQKSRVVFIGTRQLPADNAIDPVASTIQQQLVAERAVVTTVDATTAGQLARTPSDWIVALSPDQVELAVAAAQTRPAGQRPKIITNTADLATMHRLILGQVAQSMFVPEHQMATSAADLAVALVTKEEPPDTEDVEGVPTIRFVAEPLRLSNLTTTTVKEGRYSLEELCAAETLKRCQSLGLV